jgi:putative ABC transport system permease protein
MNIPLLAGRNISTTIPEGEIEALVNEASLNVMGWATPEEALGKEISRHRVVGVIPDFHYQSMHQEISPLLLRQNEYGQVGSLGLRIRTTDFQQTLDDLKAVWAGLGTDTPFEFSFLTDELNQLYQGEQRAARVFTLFAGLAILIACLGLFGLAAFTAEQRTKEIGVRKVLGASEGLIVYLLSKDFIKLVLVAFVLGMPLAYYAMDRWLQNFAYRVDLGVGTFALAGLLALAVAALTVSYQAIRTALLNPVDTLRYE